MLLCLASTTLGQSEEQGVYSYHVLGDCTEQTLHVTEEIHMSRDRQWEGWGFDAESAPNVKKYVEPAAAAVAVVVLGRLSVPSSFSIPQLSS